MNDELEKVGVEYSPSQPQASFWFFWHGQHNVGCWMTPIDLTWPGRHMQSVGRKLSYIAICQTLIGWMWGVKQNIVESIFNQQGNFMKQLFLSSLKSQDDKSSVTWHILCVGFVIAVNWMYPRHWLYLNANVSITNFDIPQLFKICWKRIRSFTTNVSTLPSV